MASLLISRGASVDAMVGGSDEPLLHMTCMRTLHDDGGFNREGEGGGEVEGEGAGDRDGDALRKVGLLLSHGASVDAMNSRGEIRALATHFSRVSV